MNIPQMSHCCGDLEVRTCGEYLLQQEPHTTVEIIRWFWGPEHTPKYNVTLAYFEKDVAGYNLKVVGERAFDPEVSPLMFMQSAEQGLRYLQSCEKGDSNILVASETDRQEECEKGSDGSGSNYEEIGAAIGRLVTRKQAQYGDSFSVVPKILALLYPNGVRVDQYECLLSIVRVLDKIKRVVTRHPADKESPWEDIGGYSILEMAKKIRTEKL